MNDKELEDFQKEEARTFISTEVWPVFRAWPVFILPWVFLLEGVAFTVSTLVLVGRTLKHTVGNWRSKYPLEGLPEAAEKANFLV